MEMNTQILETKLSDEQTICWVSSVWEVELYKKTAARRLFKTFPAQSPFDDRAWKVQRFTKEGIYLYAFYLYAHNNEFAILKICSSNKDDDYSSFREKYW